MSTLAYRIIKIERADASFKIEANVALVDFIDANNEGFGGWWSQVKESGGGCISIEVSALGKAVRKAAELGLSPEVVAALKKDIAWAKAQGVSDVQYDCF